MDALYDGLQSGRSLIVSGERTDLAGAVGVRVSEPVMLAGVLQVSSPGDTVRTTIQLAEPLAYTYKRDSVEVLGNVVRATHGESGEEVLGSGDGSAVLQSFTLRRSPLTYLAAPTPLGAEAALEVCVDEVRWQETENLVFLGPTDHGDVTRTDDTEQVTVVFGKGINGARLPTGVENVRPCTASASATEATWAPGGSPQLQTRPSASAASTTRCRPPAVPTGTASSRRAAIPPSA